MSEEKTGILLSGRVLGSDGGFRKIIETGKPPDIFKEGEHCKACNSRLSIYTRYTVCNRCLETAKSQLLFEKRNGRIASCLKEADYTTAALKFLKAKERKPIKRS